MFARVRCWRRIPLSAVLLVALGGLILPQTAEAQTQFTLSVPDATAGPLGSGEGMSWDVLRRNGLLLQMATSGPQNTVRRPGGGSVELVMFVLTVEDGRIVDCWKSRSIGIGAGGGTGTVNISHPYLPAIQKARVTGFSTAGRPIDAGELVSLANAAENAGPAADPKSMLLSDMSRGRGFVLFVAPASGGAGSQTTPLFLHSPSIAKVPAAFPDVCKIEFDERAAVRLLERTNSSITVSDLLRTVGSVQIRSAERVRLVLYIYQMQGAKVLRRFRSSPFAAPASGVVSLREVLRAGEPEFGSFAFDPANLVEAAKPIPAGSAVDDPGRFVIDGVIPYQPKGWESMQTFYVVATPADRRQAEGTAVSVGVAFGEAEH